MASQANRLPFPGPPPPERARIVLPAPGQHVEFYCLSLRLSCWPQHWYERRSCPCLGARCPYPGCRTEGNPRLIWYAAGWVPWVRQCLIASFTPYSLECCPGLEHEQVRGWRIRQWRVGETSRGRLAVEVLGQTDPRWLPRPFDLQGRLAQIWSGCPCPPAKPPPVDTGEEQCYDGSGI